MRTSIMSGAMYFALLLLLGAFPFTANGASYQSTNINRLFQALDNVVRADNHCQAGDEYEAQTRLRVASYRVRIVLADIRYTSGLGKAVEALTITDQKLNDPYLNPDEKVAFALDCLAVALPALIRVNERYTGPTRAVLDHFRVVKFLTAANVFGPVKEVLIKAKRFLRPVGCPTTSYNYRKALEAINVAIDKASDNGLRPDEKEFFVLDCLAVAEKHIRGF